MTPTFSNIDFFNLDMHLTDQQKATRQRVRDFNEQEVLPHINPYWENAEFPHDIAMKLKDLDIMGGMQAGYGMAGLDPIEFGLVVHELAKADGSIATFFGVQSNLAIGTIALLEDDEQKKRWLPDMARLEKIGAFGLTEPDIGSDAARVKTRVRKDGDYYILNGAKRWIGNASISDVLIIWARDEDTGEFGGYIIEDASHTDGVTLSDIQGKISKRAVLNADITLENVRVPKPINSPMQRASEMPRRFYL